MLGGFHGQQNLEEQSVIRSYWHILTYIECKNWWSVFMNLCGWFQLFAVASFLFGGILHTIHVLKTSQRCQRAQSLRQTGLTGVTTGLSQVMRNYLAGAELLWLLKQPGCFPAKNRSDFELMELDIFSPQPGKVSLGIKIRAVCGGMGVAGRDCEVPSV